MVCPDGIADVGLFLVLLTELHPQECVWQLGLIIGYLTDVVQEAGTLSVLGVETQFTGHDGAEVSGLAGVLEEVLPVGRAVLHLTDEADELGVHTMDTEVDDGALPRLDDLFLDLLTHLRDDLFDAGRVDTAVLDELMQGQTCYLTAHGVKATEDDGFGGVVDDDLDTRSGLEGADVTPLTADDTALDLIALDVEDGDGVLDSRLGRQALDRLYDDALGLLIGGHLRFFDDLVDIALSLVLGFGAKALDKTLTRLVCRESAEGFEALLLALTEELQLSLLLLVLSLLDVVFFLLQLDALTL